MVNGEDIVCSVLDTSVSSPQFMTHDDTLQYAQPGQLQGSTQSRAAILAGNHGSSMYGNVRLPWRSASHRRRSDVGSAWLASRARLRGAGVCNLPSNAARVQRC